MSDNGLGNPTGGDEISVGDIIGSEAIATGREAIAVKTTGDVTIYKGPTYPRLNYRSDIAHIIAYYTETFVGREQEWAALADFAGQEMPGYKLVEALPGYGKSALIAQLIHRQETDCWDQPPVPALLYFFIRQQGGRNTPVPFLQAINSQLLELLKLPGGVPTDLSALRGQFSQLWSQALEAASLEKPLLLLADGLDEMAPGEVTIADLLPANLGPYVHVVVSSRPNPEPLQQVALEHPFKQAGVLRLYTFDEAEIKSLLQEYGAAAGMAAALAPRVLEVTKGEPLFARFVCQDVAKKGEAALARLKKDQPRDVEDYFSQQFKQLETLAEGDLTWDILGLLVVALGGMTVEEIVEALDLGKRQTRKAVEPIRRFLLGETKLELMHLQLRKVVAEEFSKDEQATHRQKLLDWCRSYQQRKWPDDTPDYVLAHCAEHLKAAGQKEALYALIDKRWMDLKLERTYSHRAFARDVGKAIEIANDEKSPSLVQLVRGCLVYATLGSLATDIPPEVLGVLAQVGQAAKARGYAALMQDAKKQSQAYQLIGGALLEQGEVTEGRVVLAQALAAAEAIENEIYKARALSGIAQALAQIGEKDRATEIAHRALADANAISDEVSKAEVQSEVAQALAQAGEFGRALAAAEAIGKEKAKAQALEGVAQALAWVDEKDGLDQALAMAEAIRNEEYKAWAMSGVAQALAQTDEKDRAAEVANRALAAAEAIGDEIQKVGALIEVLQALAQAGDKDGLNRALAVVEAIEKELAAEADTLREMGQTMAQTGERDEVSQSLALVWGIKAVVLSEVAQALAQAGEKDRAAETANRALAAAEAIRDEEFRANALIRIVQTLAQAREKDKAISVANRAWTAAEAIEMEWAKTARLSEVAQALAQMGEFGQAWRVAETIGNKNDKSRALSEVAQALAQAGEKDRAIEMADRALATAEAIGHEECKARALSGMAQALAQAGEKDGAAEVANRALAAAEAIGYEQSKVRALRRVAQALAQTGEKDRAAEVANRALAVVEAIEDGRHKAEALSGVAQALAQAGEKGRVAEVANRALVPFLIGRLIILKAYKAETLNEVAQALAQAGEKDEAAEVANWALAVAEEVPDTYDKARALSGVAQALAQAGEKGRAAEVANRALAVAEAIEEEFYRVKALRGMVQALAQALAQAGEKDEAAEVANWALAVAEAIEDGKHKAEALSGVAQALARGGEKERAADVANQALAVAEAIGKEEYKARALKEVAQVLTQAGQQGQARRALRTAFTMARMAGRESVFKVLESGATTLAAIDQGQTLWEVYQAVMEVEGWWGRP